jgi:hypothetical protein
MTHLAPYPVESGWPHDATPEELYAEAHANDAPHYHVVAFINGCLNDYDSGPFYYLENAREDLRNYLEYGGMQPDQEIVPAGTDRYTNGPYIIKIEECTEPECTEGE